jgi:hypothetical protein
MYPALVFHSGPWRGNRWIRASAAELRQVTVALGYVEISRSEQIVFGAAASTSNASAFSTSSAAVRISPSASELSRTPVGTIEQRN